MIAVDLEQDPGYALIDLGIGMVRVNYEIDEQDAPPLRGVLLGEFEVLVGDTWTPTDPADVFEALGGVDAENDLRVSILDTTEELRELMLGAPDG